MSARAVSALPSYLLTLMILILVGATSSMYLINYYSSLSRQDHYIGAAIKYNFKIENNMVTINIANSKDYPAKIDIFLVTASNRILTTCNGSIYYHTDVVSGALQLLGMRIEPNEIITVICFERNIRDVKVFEHGVEVSERAVAVVGRIPTLYDIAAIQLGIGGTTNIRFGIGIPWSAYGFSYRLPVTLVVRNSYSRVYGEIIINRNTVGDQLFNFIFSNTRPDGKDFLVVSSSGTRLPTSTQKTGSAIIVTFELTNVVPGVHRFYLYFGNPNLNQEINPIKSNPPWSPKISTPSNGLPRNYLSSEFVYPAYVIPETNWYPDCEELRYGHLYTTLRSTLDSWENTIELGTYDTLKQLISSALSNKRSYPVGSQSSLSDYIGLTPKTVYGSAPWATLTVVPLPSFAPDTLVYDVRTLLYVASDDGSSAYVIGFKHTEEMLYKRNYYKGLNNPHGPRYAGYRGYSNWNYEYSGIILQSRFIEGSELFLVIIQQNGIRSGSGPGWIDFRFVMWWIEKPYTYLSNIGQRSNWLTGWRYRKAVDILGDALGPIDNYIVRIVVRYGGGTDSYDTMYCNGKCRTDFSDIRFTASDGVTTIPYCLGARVNGEYAVFYIRIQRPGQGEKTRIYVYYGNNQASLENNCRAVFGRDIAMLYSSDRYYDALILVNREWVSGGSFLCRVHDDSCPFHLPFRVKIYDTDVSCVHVVSNGFIRWDCVSDYPRIYYLDTQKKVLAPHAIYLVDPYVYVGSGWDNTLGHYTFITWDARYFFCYNSKAVFQTVLYRNWVIQFNIFNISTCGVNIRPYEFISAGNGSDYIDLSPRWRYLESVIFVPRFRTAYGDWSSEESR
ncbi:MAG: DUF2341 domain-containing protein [Ignisphaera sp.]